MTNVLILIVDELSWWALGHTGGVAVTPNIDALAATGRQFTAAYTPSPMCVPARAALAAGRPVSDTRCWDSVQAYRGTPQGWGHALQAAGIACESFGKLHYVNGDADTGFDHQHEALHIPGTGWGLSVLRRPVPEYTAAAEMAELIGAGPFPYQEFDRRVVDQACAWLTAPERHAAPWCGFVSLLCPHYPLIAPQEDYALYDPQALAAEAEAVPDHPIVQELARFFSYDRHFTARTRGIGKAGYYGLCTFMDRQIGRVLETLAQAGLQEDTLVVFTSDHGEMLGEKGFWGKCVMYESSVRVPLILSGPGVSGGVDDTPVCLTDLAPTICGALDVAADFPGDDLRNALDPARDALSEYHDGGASVGVTMLRWNQDGQAWKLVHYAEGYPAQLFCLSDDPTETQNLVATRPDVLAEGLRRLTARLDPEAVNAQAHADQAVAADALGGRAALEAAPQWNFTPTS